MTATRLLYRAVIRLSGDDPRGFLNGLVTNDVTGALPVYAGLLSAQGKTLYDLIVWPGEGDDLLLDCEAAVADELVKRLSMYRLRRLLTIAVDPTLAVYWQAGPGAGTPDPRLAALGQRWIAPGIDKDRGADADWLAHRLALGVAEGRAEQGEVLWLETNAAELGGVSFSKGCYIGQENTARMNWRNKVNRRLIVVPAARSQENRRKALYPELGLAVDLLRVEDLDPALVPAWLTLSAAG